MGTRGRSAAKRRFWKIHNFRKGLKATDYKCFKNGYKVPGCASIQLVHKFLRCGTYQCSATPPCFIPPMAAVPRNSHFNPHAMLFDLGGTAKSRYFAHVRAHCRTVYGSLALSVTQVHRLVMIFKIYILLRPNS